MTYRTVKVSVIVTPSTPEKWAQTVADDMELAIAEAFEAFQNRRKMPHGLGISFEMDSTAPRRRLAYA